ncbi:MAG: TolC family protein [Bacteroidota bacterium]
MKKLIQIVKLFSLIVVLLCSVNELFTQSLDQLKLTDAYQMLEERYPLLKDEDIVVQINEKELEKIEKEKLPTINFKVDGRLQSQSVELDAGEMAPIDINQPLVALQSYLEATYMVMDGGIKDAQKKLKNIQMKVDQQNLKVEKYALRNLINQFFLGIKTLKTQEELIEISLKDLEARAVVVKAGVEYGTLLESELTKIEVKQLELTAMQSDLNQQIEKTAATLSAYIDQPVTAETQLIFPDLPDHEVIPDIERPEHELFELQRQSILAQSDLIEAGLKPKLGAFAQAGVGYPNPLNLLDSGVAPYGLIGVNFEWKLSDWKKSSTEKQLLSLQAQRLNNAEETFNFNIQMQEDSYLGDVRRLKNQIQYDSRIAEKQSLILNQLSAQLDEGVITATDYLLQVNAELSARQNVVIHEVELLKVQLEFLNQRGGY